MNKNPYTDADVALVANYVPLGFTERDPYRDVDEAARAILNAVAPAIAARALREAAEWIDDVSEAGDGLYAGDCTGMLLDRADWISPEVDKEEK